MWLIAEKLIAVFGLIFVTSYVAKYVGPTTFGVISISMLVFQFIQSVAMMGSDVILLKRISQNHRSGMRLMMSAILLVLVLYCVLSAISLIVMHTESDATSRVFIFAAAIACLFSGLDMINIYNEARLNAKLNVIANISGLIISLIIRYGISYYQLEPTFLAIPIVLATFIPFMLKILIFKYQGNSAGLPSLRHMRRYTRYMFHTGSTLVLSVIAITIYTRLNQMSVYYFLGMKEAGVFSVAMTLSVAWVFLPNALLASFYPSFFSERDPGVAVLRIQKLLLLVICLSVCIILAIAIAGPYFIRHFYGPAYTEAIGPMVWLSVGAMFGVLSSVIDRYIIKYNGYRYLIWKTFGVLLICIITTITMVPALGLKGAALSVVITELLAFTLLNYFFRAQPVTRIHKIFLSPGAIWAMICNVRSSRS